MMLRDGNAELGTSTGTRVFHGWRNPAHYIGRQEECLVLLCLPDVDKIRPTNVLDCECLVLLRLSDVDKIRPKHVLCVQSLSFRRVLRRRIIESTVHYLCHYGGRAFAGNCTLKATGRLDSRDTDEWQTFWIAETLRGPFRWPNALKNETS
jgi:hypothetical protein